MNEGRQVTTIVQDHVEGLAVRECSQSLLNTPVVFLFGLTLPGEDRNAGSGNTAQGKQINSRFLNPDQEFTHAEAAWSWVEKIFCYFLYDEDGKVRCTIPKLTQEDQVTSAPRAVKVSINTAVWMVL